MEGRKKECMRKTFEVLFSLIQTVVFISLTVAVFIYDRISMDSL